MGIVVFGGDTEVPVFFLGNSEAYDLLSFFEDEHACVLNKLPLRKGVGGHFRV